jgi:hypothetical protein
MPNTIKTWVKMIGDVIEINGQQVTLETVNYAGNGTKYIDNHPVMVPEAVLPKIKVGKKLGFTGIIRRIGNRTKLVLNPEHFSVNQSKLKDLYVNQAGMSGHVVFKSFFGNDPNKKSMLTIGIGELGTTGTAIYGSLWRDLASHWNTLLQGHEAIVQIVGYMRSRLMTGARAGDTMYEVIANREKSSILSRTPITTGFEDFDDGTADALMALEFEVPAEATGSAENGTADHLPGGAPEDDDIPF